MASQSDLLPMMIPTSGDSGMGDILIAGSQDGLPAELYDAVLPALGCPWDFLIVLSHNLVGFVEIEEHGLEGPGHRAVRFERAGRLDMYGEVLFLSGRVPVEGERVAFEHAAQLDRIAVRPEERSRDRCSLL